jgi:GTPase SAR1 family protein
MPHTNSSVGQVGCGMYLIRLLIVGDTGVGKTSLLIRFHEDQFIVHQKTTIGERSSHPRSHHSSGVDYKAKEVRIENEVVKLQVKNTTLISSSHLLSLDLGYSWTRKISFHDLSLLQ